MPAPMPAPMPQQQAFVPGQPVAMVSPAYGFPAMSRPVLPDENRQENRQESRIVIPKEEIQCRNRLKRLGVQPGQFAARPLGLGAAQGIEDVGHGRAQRS